MKQFLLKMFLCVATILVFQVAQSQDYLFTINADTLKTKVLEVNENDVRYKDFENPDGPIYTINKSNIDKIIYQNGKVELYRKDQSNNNPNSNVNLPKLLTYDELMKMNDFEKETYLSTVGIQSIYEKFQKGQSLSEKGKKILGTGLFLTIGGGVLFGTGLVIIKDRLEEGAILYFAGSAALSVGQLLIIASIPLSAVGGAKKLNAENMYRDFTNGQYVSYIPPKLNFGLTQNGIGLSLKF